MAVEQRPGHQRGVQAEAGRGGSQPQADLGGVRLAERLQPETDSYYHVIIAAVRVIVRLVIHPRPILMCPSAHF